MLIIVIVDDEVSNYYDIEKAVRQCQGCITFHAHSSRSFFKLIKRVVPDFIFLKEVMPGPDGMYCIKKIRSIRKYNSVPVIMYSKQQISREAYKNKPNLYIVKPDDCNNMSVVINSILTFDWKSNLFPAAEMVV